MNPEADQAEIAEIKRLDPDNVERWTRRQFGALRGMEFRFNARFPNPGYFRFLALKSPSGWSVSPLHPNIDTRTGHDHHLVTRRIGGQEVPVICGPDGREATSLREAREFAVKWSVYIEGKLNNLQPRQSQ